MSKKNIFDTSAFTEFLNTDNGYFVNIKTSFGDYDNAQLIALYPDFVLIAVQEKEIFIKRNEVLCFEDNS
ncbi:hypothetical protein [Leptotrichia trevisanii]|uniref:hypothetical protein n=1 Tax=Leptotrichia trevisanii TaxID=109328 RepID=UPI0004187125|nr:hypothetical protein [Leptotrichia trevisanii]